MDVAFHKNFVKQYRALPQRTRIKCDARLVAFRKDPFASSLRNHALHGVYKGYRSIDVTGDVRAVYEPVSEDLAYFIFIGTHSELYS